MHYRLPELSTPLAGGIAVGLLGMSPLIYLLAWRIGPHDAAIAVALTMVAVAALGCGVIFGGLFVCLFLLHLMWGWEHLGP